MASGETTRRRGLSIELWPIERPIPYARNARICPEEAIASVASSIREYGFRQPLVVDAEGVIIAGHTRLLAAQHLGLEKVPVHIARDLSPAQVRAYRLADNRSADETSWDYDLLPLELAELGDLGYDLALTGFGDEELQAILSTETVGLCDPDEVPEPPQVAITKPGDIWLLGKHRLLCGDATKAEDVTRLMAGKRAALMATDPPYLVDYDGGNHPRTVGNGGKWQPGMGNPSKWKPKEATKHWDAYTDPTSAAEFYRSFLTTAVTCALGERPAIYQFFAVMRTDIVFEAWRQAGLLAHQILIWKKSRAVLTHCDFLWDYEPFVYGWIQGKKPEKRPPSDSRTTWEIESKIEDNPGSVHPTMKPTELIRRPIEYHSAPGELIFEPFSGSGTAIIAAELTGRACYALELSPIFCDVAVQRWQRFTGKLAVRDV
jgi:DNA modification methylase